jgi:hypothetical protein
LPSIDADLYSILSWNHWHSMFLWLHFTIKTVVRMWIETRSNWGFRIREVSFTDINCDSPLRSITGMEVGDGQFTWSEERKTLVAVCDRHLARGAREWPLNKARMELMAEHAVNRGVESYH